jgi:hypothetical protein
MAASIPPIQAQKGALGQVELFQAVDGQVSLDVRLEADTVWLSQGQMAELFGRERSVITRHVGNVFREGELPEPCNVHFLHAFGSDRPVLHRHPIQGLASHHQHVTLNWLATG